jgi:hypothetical protein
VKFVSLLLALGAVGMTWWSMERNSLVSTVIWALTAPAFIGLAATPTLMAGAAMGDALITGSDRARASKCSRGR